MNNANMLKPALIGGAALGILSAFPGLSYCNCVCCAWAIGGGILAAYLYVQGSPFQVTMGRGAGVGLATGAIGGIVCSLFSIPLQFMLTGVGSTALAMERFQELMTKNADLPDDIRRNIEAFLLRSDFMVLFAIFNLFMNIVSFSLFAMLGGAIGVAVFEKRKPGNSHPSMPPPQPPEDIPPNSPF